MSNPNKQTEDDFVICPHCGCTWFEEIVERRHPLPGFYSEDNNFSVEVLLTPAAESDSSAFSDRLDLGLFNAVRVRLYCAECCHSLEPKEYQRQAQIHEHKSKETE